MKRCFLLYSSIACLSWGTRSMASGHTAYFVRWIRQRSAQYTLSTVHSPAQGFKVTAIGKVATIALSYSFCFSRRTRDLWRHLNALKESSQPQETPVVSSILMPAGIRRTAAPVQVIRSPRVLRGGCVRKGSHRALVAFERARIMERPHSAAAQQ